MPPITKPEDANMLKRVAKMEQPIFETVTAAFEKLRLDVPRSTTSQELRRIVPSSKQETRSMQTTASTPDAQKLGDFRKAFGVSAQLPTMFASCDAFVEHMVRAAFDADAGLKAEFPDAGAYLGYLQWAEGQAGRG